MLSNKHKRSISTTLKTDHSGNKEHIIWQKSSFSFFVRLFYLHVHIKMIYFRNSPFVRFTSFQYNSTW